MAVECLVTLYVCNNTKEAILYGSAICDQQMFVKALLFTFAVDDPLQIADLKAHCHLYENKKYDQTQRSTEPTCVVSNVCVYKKKSEEGIINFQEFKELNILNPLVFL